MRYTKSTLKKCSICGQEMPARGIGTHMRLKHRLRVVTQVSEVPTHLSDGSPHLSEFMQVTQTVKHLSPVNITPGRAPKENKKEGMVICMTDFTPVSKFFAPDEKVVIATFRIYFTSKNEADYWRNYVYKEKNEFRVVDSVKISQYPIIYDWYFTKPYVSIKSPSADEALKCNYGEVLSLKTFFNIVKLDILSEYYSAGSAEEQPAGHDRRGDA